MPLSPADLSQQLRQGQSRDMQLRRWAVGLSLVGVAAGIVVSAYQTGLVKRLPDPPGGLFNATRVNASDYAYKRLQTPDGLLMIANYAATAILGGAGGAHRGTRAPWLSLALAGKAMADVVVNAKLFVEEWRTNRALCQYCLAANLASWATLLMALPEAMQAGRRLLGRDASV